MVRIVWSEEDSLLQVDPKRALAWFGEEFCEVLEHWGLQLRNHRFGPRLFGERRIVLPMGIKTSVEFDPFPSLLVHFPNRTYPVRLTFDIWGKNVHRAREWTVFLSPRELDYSFAFWATATVWMLRDRKPPSWIGSNLSTIDLASYALALLNLQEDYFHREKGDRAEKREAKVVYVTFSNPYLTIKELLFPHDWLLEPNDLFTVFPDPDRAFLAAIRFIAQVPDRGDWEDGNRAEAFLFFGPHGIGKERLEPVLRDLFFPEQEFTVKLPVVRSLTMGYNEYEGWVLDLSSSFTPCWEGLGKGYYPWVRAQRLWAPSVDPERIRGLEAMTVLAEEE